jgi:glycosyltransferase involved in cell wall biosynthesis
MNKLPLSIIVPVKNEAKNLADCLASVTWADEVFVVDSHSNDGTQPLAESLGARVVQFDYNGGWPKKKNWAIANLPLRNEWVMILDADERVTPALEREIGDAIQRPGIDGYYIRWKFMFLGRWMKHSWSHGWMLRLFRRGTGQYEDLGMRGEGGWDNEVHENIVVAGRTGRLQELLLHESNQDLAYWIRKQNEFSTWNAARRRQQLAEGFPRMAALFSSDPLQRRKWLKAVYLRLPGKPIWMFVYLYLLKFGFLDGKAGLYFCALRAAHEVNTSAKVYERLAHESRQGIA